MSVSDLYIPTIGQLILLQENMGTDPGNIQITHGHKNVEIRIDAAQFLFWEQIHGIFVEVCSPIVNMYKNFPYSIVQNLRIYF